MNEDFKKILDALDNLMGAKGAGEGIWRAAELGDVTARALVGKAMRDIDKLQEMTGPQMYKNIEAAEIKAIAERAGVSEDEILQRLASGDITEDRGGGVPGDFPKSYTTDQVPRGAFADQDQKNVYQYDDPSVLLKQGTGTKKAQDQLEKYRASLTARGDIAGGDARLVSDTLIDDLFQTNPATRYNPAEGVYDTARETADFDLAYVKARELGLSDQDAKAMARLKVGQPTTEATADGQRRQARADTPMTDHRKMMTKMAILNASQSDDPTFDPMNIGEDMREYKAPVAPESEVAAGPSTPVRDPAEPADTAPRDVISDPVYQRSLRGRKAMKWGAGHTAASLLAGLGGLYGLSEIYDYD